MLEAAHDLQSLRENPMIPENRLPTHPGEILLEEFLKPMDRSRESFAQHIDVPVQQVDEVMAGTRAVTAEMAWLLSEALGTTPQFWLNLQSAHDLARNRPDKEIRRLQITG